jgi:DNA-3-methyladenine glycosylase II
MPHRKVHRRFVETAQSLSPALAEAITRLGPQKLPSRADLPFTEYLCRAIVGQQLSTIAARTIWRRVVESANGRPLLDQFHEGNAERLRACGMSGAKVKAVCAIAEMDRTTGLDAEVLSALSHEERSARLTAIWGVGQWTADMMSIFYFGDPDIWPDGDVAARKTLTRLTSPRRKTVLTAARFAPYRSYLALYMWAHVDAPPT